MNFPSKFNSIVATYTWQITFDPTDGWFEVYEHLVWRICKFQPLLSLFLLWAPKTVATPLFEVFKHKSSSTRRLCDLFRAFLKIVLTCLFNDVYIFIFPLWFDCYVLRLQQGIIGWFCIIFPSFCCACLVFAVKSIETVTFFCLYLH